LYSVHFNPRARKMDGAEYFVQPRIWKEGGGFEYVKVEVTVDSIGIRVALLTDSPSEDRSSLGHDSSRFFDILANQPTVTTLAVDMEDPVCIACWEVYPQPWQKFCLLLVKSLPNLQSLELKHLYDQFEDDDWPTSLLLGAMKKTKITRLTMLAGGDADEMVSLYECFDHVAKFKSLRKLSIETTSESGGLGPTSCAILAKAVKGLKKLEELTLPLKAILETPDDPDEHLDEVMEAVRGHKNLQKNGVSNDIQNSLDALLLIKRCVAERNLDDPPTASEQSELAAWVAAMADCLEKNRFDSFHYFFSQMDPMLYLSSGHFKPSRKAPRKSKGLPRKRARRSEVELLS
jgi:hypothetical protein